MYLTCEQSAVYILIVEYIIQIKLITEVIADVLYVHEWFFLSTKKKDHRNNHFALWTRKSYFSISIQVLRTTISCAKVCFTINTYISRTACTICSSVLLRGVGWSCIDCRKEIVANFKHTILETAYQAI